MPFPWKKKKVARISNFVADLHSPKRGSSLVVQTGFPTSLIDLFVKNRSRFKKPNPRKRPPHEIHDPPPPDLSHSLHPRPEPTCPEASTSERLVRNGDDGVTGSEVHDRLGECIGGSNSDPNKVIAALLKMFVVLAVTLSVNKLTFGITISAFVLLFLEFAGKHVVSWFKPCSDANMAFKYFSQRIYSCDWYQNLVSVVGKRQSCEGLEPPSLVREKIEVQLSSSSLGEIEIVELKSETGTENRCTEIRLLGPELNSFYVDKKGIGSEIEEVCEITQEDKTKSKRSGKLKSRIAKKLVPKKLRDLKKKRRTKNREEIEIEKLSKEKEAESCGEVPSFVEGDESAISEIEEGIEEQERWSKLKCIEDEEVDFGITGSEQRVEEGESNVQEQERIDGGESSESGALMLFAVALAGLIVGRFAAFLLAVTWIFMLKILRSRARSLNVSSVVNKSLRR